MTTVCSICDGIISQDDSPAMVGTDGQELVSHGMRPACGLAFYGEDFSDILAGEPT